MFHINIDRRSQYALCFALKQIVTDELCVRFFTAFVLKMVCRIRRYAENVSACK